MFGMLLKPGIVLKSAMLPVVNSEPVRPPGICASIASRIGHSRSVSTGKLKAGLVLLFSANLIKEGAIQRLECAQRDLGMLPTKGIEFGELVRRLREGIIWILGEVGP